VASGLVLVEKVGVGDKLMLPDTSSTRNFNPHFKPSCHTYMTSSILRRGGVLPYL